MAGEDDRGHDEHPEPGDADTAAPPAAPEIDFEKIKFEKKKGLQMFLPTRPPADDPND